MQESLRRHIENIIDLSEKKAEHNHNIGVKQNKLITWKSELLVRGRWQDARSYPQVVEVKNVTGTLYVSGQAAVLADGTSSNADMKDFILVSWDQRNCGNWSPTDVLHAVSIPIHIDALKQGSNKGS